MTRIYVFILFRYLSVFSRMMLAVFVGVFRLLMSLVGPSWSIRKSLYGFAVAFHRPAERRARTHSTTALIVLHRCPILDDIVHTCVNNVLLGIAVSAGGPHQNEHACIYRIQ